ncbi:hypothetical protein AAHC03_019121 [Spirometra sp. Aus1]
MFLLPLLTALVVLNFRPCNCQGRLLAVQQDTNIDYLFAIDSSYVFHSSTSGFVQGTAQRPCQPSANCVEFYPEKRSFMIKADSHANYSAVILTPEASDRATIAIVIVNEGEFFPELRGVQFIKPVIFKSFNENSFGVILDENVKEFKLIGNISKYGSPSPGTGLEIVIPYERVNGGQYKIMRVTGRVATQRLSFSLTDNAGNSPTYDFTPSSNAPILMMQTRLLQWPKTSKTSGALEHAKWSALLISVTALYTL